MPPHKASERESKGVCRKRILLLLLLFLLGIAYSVWYHFTEIGVPCIFRLITGLKCPGCGITTMLSALLFLDFRAAFAANPYLLLSLPFLLFEIVFEFFRRRHHLRSPLWNYLLLILYTIGLFVFAVLRNLSEQHIHM